MCRRGIFHDSGVITGAIDRKDVYFLKEKPVVNLWSSIKVSPQINRETMSWPCGGGGENAAPAVVWVAA